ncbi:Structure-specific endonuclease subunit slx1 [Trametes pubescens]|uniref:Structure-specific endonuclease subunit slx1 n=1 Tax=Trametes pubescens TaxID=154538 RepID=A0A1M2VXB1_TRAPU|nr:Structure-specific endonuclease subunit slx1 [Trametes pubescens]
MVSSHPYNTWPLSVKLFTEEAAKIWNASAKDASIPPLPEGLTVSLEYEGVDGKSGKPGAGRTGPIDVVDTAFTTEHLQKGTSLFSPPSRLQCSICHGDISHNTDPLTTALCPTNGCKSVTHLACLSRDFLNSAPSTSSDIIPRGGTCKSCHSYILWGDVIRGCYRRHQGGATPENEPEEPDDQEDGLAQLLGEAAEEELEGPSQPKPRKPAGPPLPTKRGRGRPPKAKPAPFSTVASSDGEHEHFDLNAISSCSEEDSDDAGGLPWTRRRPHLHSKPPSRSVPSGSRLPDEPPRSIPATAGSSRGTVPAVGGPGRGARQISHNAGSRATGAAAIEDRGARLSSITAPRSAGAGFARDDRDSHGAFDVPRGSGPVDARTVTTLAPRGERDDTGDAPPQDPARAGKRFPEERTLRSFPDLPPLSQPPSPAATRTQRIHLHDNEIVEISDSD